MMSPFDWAIVAALFAGNICWSLVCWYRAMQGWRRSNDEWLKTLVAWQEGMPPEVWELHKLRQLHNEPWWDEKKELVRVIPCSLRCVAPAHTLRPDGAAEWICETHQLSFGWPLQNNPRRCPHED